MVWKYKLTQSSHNYVFLLSRTQVCAESSKQKTSISLPFQRLISYTFRYQSKLTCFLLTFKWGNDAGRFVFVSILYKLSTLEYVLQFSAATCSLVLVQRFVDWDKVSCGWNFWKRKHFDSFIIFFLLLLLQIFVLFLAAFDKLKITNHIIIPLDKNTWL